MWRFLRTPVYKSGANKACIDSINNTLKEDQRIEIRQVKYLNNIVEKAHIFMSLGGIGLTPSPLGENFSIVQGCTTEKVRIAHMI